MSDDEDQEQSVSVNDCPPPKRPCTEDSDESLPSAGSSTDEDSH